LADQFFEIIRSNLDKNEPREKGLRFAAVSVMLRDRLNPSVLLIKRAERAGDPWSGQIAFPGGKTQPEDRTARGTATRETLEEVGIDLSKVAEFLGYGTLTTTHTGTMDVVPTVFLMKEEVEATANDEVASYRWIQLGELLAPGSKSSFRLKTPGSVVELPAYTAGDYVVWGLTHRILDSLLKSPR
jgi:8-oxo-dGTP pyrophosphatase MutT (NUDIX family)